MVGRTLSVVVKIGELIVPLRENAQGIFEKGTDDQKSTDGW